MRLLLVGDPHVTVDELEDSQALLDGVFSLYRQLEPSAVVFMGDLHHNHAVVRVEVLDFWLRNLARFPKEKTFVLVGNHDRPNDSSSGCHSLQAYTSLANVVEKPTHIGDGIWAFPYMQTEEFVTAALATQPKVLLCHQTFDGSKYENGFYAPDGVKPEHVGVPKVISGHIHTAQVLNWVGGYIQYIGSPRWRSISDANVEKSVVLYDTDQDTFDGFPTNTFCKPIYSFTVKTVNDLENCVFKTPGKVFVDVMAIRADFEDLACKIRAKIPNAKIRPIFIESKKADVQESQGIYNALRQFVASFSPPYGTPKEVLLDLVSRRLNGT